MIDREFSYQSLYAPFMMHSIPEIDRIVRSEADAGHRPKSNQQYL
jgi:hypothetical protein